MKKKQPDKINPFNMLLLLGYDVEEVLLTLPKDQQKEFCRLLDTAMRHFVIGARVGNISPLLIRESTIRTGHLLLKQALELVGVQHNVREVN